MGTHDNDLRYENNQFRQYANNDEYATNPHPYDPQAVFALI
jgi:hypothetical protein